MSKNTESKATAGSVATAKDTAVSVFTASDLNGSDVKEIAESVTSADADGIRALYASTVGAMLIRAFLVLRGMTETGDPRSQQAAKDVVGNMTPAERSQATNGARVLTALGSRPSAESLRLAAALIRRKVNGDNVKAIKAAKNAAERNAVMLAALESKVADRAARPSSLTAASGSDDTDDTGDDETEGMVATVKVIAKHVALVMAEGVTLTDDERATLASIGAALAERFSA